MEWSSRHLPCTWPLAPAAKTIAVHAFLSHHLHITLQEKDQRRLQLTYALHNDSRNSSQYHSHLQQTTTKSSTRLAPRFRIYHPPESRPWQYQEMAMLSNKKSSSSSSNYSRKSDESVKRSSTQASAYLVDAVTMELTGYHFSTGGGQGRRWWV